MVMLIIFAHLSRKRILQIESNFQYISELHYYFDGHWSLHIYKFHVFITNPVLPSILEILPSIPEKWGRASKMTNFGGQISGYECQFFFLLPWIHIGMGFMQKTGSKLVKFCFCGPIYILHPPIGGSHPVPCLTTQITERRGTAMYYYLLQLHKKRLPTADIDHGSWFYASLKPAFWLKYCKSAKLPSNHKFKLFNWSWLGTQPVQKMG